MCFALQKRYDEMINMNMDFQQSLDCESQGAMDGQCQAWSKLYKASKAMVQNHIQILLETQYSLFSELKHFQDPLLCQHKNEDPDRDYQQQMSLKDEGEEAAKSEGDIASQILVKVIYDNWMNQQSFPFLPLLTCLCQIKGYSSIFELLEAERKKAVADYLDSQESEEISHFWELDKLDKMMIKTDDPFIHNDVVWKLGITYNRSRDTTLNININIVVNPFQDRKGKIYFKKNEFFVPSNSSMVHKGLAHSNMV